MDQPKAESPLLGSVLCCTSIPPEERTTLAEHALAMGAQHKLDLTADVTHLIVGSIDTPKYKYVAKQRPDIKVVLPSWVDAVHEAWMDAAEKVDVDRLELEHKCPVLEGLQICVTGFEDFNERTSLQETITRNGATYHGDLTKVVTHLIAAAPRGKKYEYAGQWGVKVVATEWLTASLERGMALEEALFHPTTPAEDRGVGAVLRRRSTSPSMLGKRPLETAVDLGKRKLRRTASAKLGSQTDGIWADIGSAETPREEQPDTEPAAAHTVAGAQEPAPVGAYQPTPTIAIERVSSREPLSIDARNEKIRKSQNVFKQPGRDRAERVFIHGFKQRETQILQKFLQSHGADLMSESDMRERFSGLADVVEPKEALSADEAVTLIIPTEIGSKDLAGFRASDYIANCDEVVTSWWVEKCLHGKELVDKKGPLCEPFEHFPIPGFEKLIICPTGFYDMDLLHFSRAIKLLSGSESAYDETLRIETSLLVCNGNPTVNRKIKYALENKIPVVSAHWLWSCIRSGVCQPTESFALKGVEGGAYAFWHPVLDPRPARKGARQEKPEKEISAEVEAHKKQRKTDRQSRSTSPSKHDSFRSSDAKEGATFVTGLSRDTSQPLQEIAPEVNSPHARHSTSDHSASSKGSLGATSNRHLEDSEQGATHLIADDEEPGRPSEQDHDSVLGPLQRQPKHDQDTPASAESQQATQNTTLNRAIAHLLAHKRPPSAAADAQPDRPQTLGQRRHRPLGRASSSLSRTSSLAGSPPLALEEGQHQHQHQQTYNAELDPNDAAAGGSAADAQYSPSAPNPRKQTEGMFRPSQALSYDALDEDPAADRARGTTGVNGAVGSLRKVKDEVVFADPRGETARRRTLRKRPVAETPEVGWGEWSE